MKRLQNELSEAEKNPLSNISTGLKNSDLFEWIATILGPEGTPYEGGIFFLDIKFPCDYPLKPPKISFTTPVYHPNVNREGNICVDILKGQWSPILNIRSVLLSISSLLSDPNPDDSLVPEIGFLMKTNPEEYYKNAREWTLRHAT